MDLFVFFIFSKHNASLVTYSHFKQLLLFVSAVIKISDLKTGLIVRDTSAVAVPHRILLWSDNKILHCMVQLKTGPTATQKCKDKTSSLTANYHHTLIKSTRT